MKSLVVSGRLGRSGRARLLSLVLALVIAAAGLVGIDDDNGLAVMLPSEPVDWLFLGTAGATYLARRFPFAALAVAAVLDVLPYWLDITGPAYHLGVMVTVYTVTAHRPRRRSFPAVGIVLVGQTALMSWHNDWAVINLAVALTVLTITFPAALGMDARSRAHAAEALRQRALAAERSRDAEASKLLAEDRLRTARDLHDSVAHQIAVMNLNAGVATRSLRESPEEAEAALVTVREAGRGVISSISELLTGLREGQVDETQAAPDIDELKLMVDEFRTLLPELDVSFVGPRADARTVNPVLVSVVREALTNVYKHGAHDRPVLVTVRLDDSSSDVEVVNGCTEPSRTVTEGFGLTGMRERVAAVGGQLSLERSDDRFTVRASLPVKEETR